MATEKKLEYYRGFEIWFRSGIGIRVIKDGIQSPIAPGSIKAAKRIIDNYLNMQIDMYENA